MAAQETFVSPINAPSRGRRVQIGINELKSTIDEALAGGSRLLADMILAAQEASVPPAVSQRGIERMQECLKAGTEMRALAIATHRDMRKVMAKVNLPAVGFGDIGPTPDLDLWGDATVPG